MKFKPGQDRRKAGDENAERRHDDVGVGVGRAERRVKGPAGIDAAHQHGVEHEQRRPTMKMYQLSRFSLGNARSLQPIIIGTRKFPERRGNRRDQEQEHHDDPVQREQLVVSLRGDQVARRGQQLQANHGGEDAAQKEKETDGAEIQQRDALVVLGQQPGLDAVFVRQVIFASLYGCRNHTN